MSLEAELAAAVGPAHVVTDPALTRPFGTDWTRRWSTTPGMVVRPASTEQVCEVVSVCASRGAAITTQGGNTGLVGGGVPGCDGAVVLSTQRLRRLDAVDHSSRRVVAGAGTTIAALHSHAAAAGYTYGVDLGSRDSATVGGTIATNAGGIRVVRHGDTRAQVAGIEVVLADGRVMSHLAGLPKDSAGYDVGGMMVGSEGTLGIVTAADLRLRPVLPTDRQTAMVGMRSASHAVDLLDQPDLLAAEFIVGRAMDLVCAAMHLRAPLEQAWPIYVLLETAAEPRLPADADTAIDRRLWDYREQLPEAVSTLGKHVAIDVAVPLSELQQVIDDLPKIVAPHGCYLFGHLAEGNLHLQVIPNPSEAFDESVVLRYVAERGGSVSSEHGIGRAKRQFLALSRDSAEIDAMRRVKTALDPECLLNPGVLLP